MAKKWTDVEGNPEFQSLEPEAKAATQLAYFNDVVAPQLTTEEIEPTRQAFFTEFNHGNSVDMPFFSLGDAASGIVDAVRGLGSTVPAAYHQAKEGLVRPDEYSPESVAAREKAAAYNAELEATQREKVLKGEATDVGSALRQAGPSLGFSMGAMGAGIVGRIAGAGVGALSGAAFPEPTPLSETIGAAAGFLGAGGASGTAAYRMAGSQFLEDAFRQLHANSQTEKGRPMDEAEMKAAYEALLPVAQNTAAWEAGPEAVANAVMISLGPKFLGLGKEAATSLAKRAAAGAADLGTELGTEALTQQKTGIDQAKVQALVEGKPMSEAKDPYAEGGYLKALEDVTPVTLATMGLMHGGAKAVDVIVKSVTEPAAEATKETLQNPDVPPAAKAAVAESADMSLQASAEALRQAGIKAAQKATETQKTTPPAEEPATPATEAPAETAARTAQPLIFSTEEGDYLFQNGAWTLPDGAPAPVDVSALDAARQAYIQTGDMPEGLQPYEAPPVEATVTPAPVTPPVTSEPAVTATTPSNQPSPNLPPRATGNAPPRPARQGRDTSARDAWDEQYGGQRKGGKTHNEDGTPYQPTVYDETVAQVLTATRRASVQETKEAMAAAIGTGNEVQIESALTDLINAGWVWDATRGRMVNPADPQQKPGQAPTSSAVTAPVTLPPAAVRAPSTTPPAPRVAPPVISETPLPPPGRGAPPPTIETAPPPSEAPGTPEPTKVTFAPPEVTPEEAPRIAPDQAQPGEALEVPSKPEPTAPDGAPTPQLPPETPETKAKEIKPRIGRKLTPEQETMRTRAFKTHPTVETDLITQTGSLSPPVVVTVKDPQTGKTKQELGPGFKGKPEWEWYEPLLEDPAARKEVDAVLFSGEPNPDSTLDRLAPQGMTGDEFGRGLLAAAQERLKIAKQMTEGKGATDEEQRMESAEEQRVAFEKATKKGKDKKEVTTWDLNAGDTLDVDGTAVRVTEIDPDTGDATLEDGTRFGRQTLETGDAIWVEKKGEVEAPRLPRMSMGAELTEHSVAEQRLVTAVQEINEDIASGTIPETVASFSELHDYVDANEYVNDAIRKDRMIGPLGKSKGWKTAGFTDFTGELINSLDAWLKGGRQGKPINPFPAEPPTPNPLLPRQSRPKGKVLSRGITPNDVRTAADALARILPNARTAWVGTRKELEAFLRTNKPFAATWKRIWQTLMKGTPEQADTAYEAMITTGLNTVEAFTFQGRTFIITDQVQVTTEDGTPDAAARRVFIHEDAHEALEFLRSIDKDVEKQWQSLRNAIPANELDELAGTRYRSLSDWRDNADSYDELAEEWFTKKISQIEERGRPSPDSLVGKFIRFLKDLVKRFTGKDATDQALLDFVDAARMARFRERAELAERGIRFAKFTPDGDQRVNNALGEVSDEPEPTETPLRTRYELMSDEQRQQFDAYVDSLPAELKYFTQFLGNPTTNQRLRQALGPMIEFARTTMGGIWGEAPAVNTENTERAWEMVSAWLSDGPKFVTEYRKDFQTSGFAEGGHQGDAAAAVLQMELMDYAVRLANETGDTRMMSLLYPYANDMVLSDYATMSGSARNLQVRSQAVREAGVWTALRLTYANLDKRAEDEMGKDDLDTLKKSVETEANPALKKEVEESIEDKLDKTEAGKAIVAAVAEAKEPDYDSEGYWNRVLRMFEGEERADLYAFWQTLTTLDRDLQLLEAVEGAKAASGMKFSLGEDIAKTISDPAQLEALKQRVEASKGKLLELLGKITKSDTSSESKEKRRALTRNPKVKRALKAISATAQAKAMLERFENRNKRLKRDKPAWKKTFEDQIKNPKAEADFLAAVQKQGMTEQTSRKLFELAATLRTERAARPKAPPKAKVAPTPKPVDTTSKYEKEAQRLIESQTKKPEDPKAPSPLRVLQQDFLKGKITEQKFRDGMRALNVTPETEDTLIDVSEAIIQERAKGEADKTVATEASKHEKQAQEMIKRATEDKEEPPTTPLGDLREAYMKGTITEQQFRDGAQPLNIAEETLNTLVDVLDTKKQRKEHEKQTAAAVRKAAEDAEKAEKEAAKYEREATQLLVRAWNVPKPPSVQFRLSSLQKDLTEGKISEIMFRSIAATLDVKQPTIDKMVQLATATREAKEREKAAREAIRKAKEATKTFDNALAAYAKKIIGFYRQPAKERQADLDRDLKEGRITPAEHAAEIAKLGIKPKAPNMADTRAFLSFIAEQITSAPITLQEDPAWKRMIVVNALKERGMSQTQAEDTATKLVHLIDRAIKEGQAKAAIKAMRNLKKAKKLDAKKIGEAIRTRGLDPLNPHPVVAAIAKELGYNALTPAQFKRLADLDQQANTEGPTRAGLAYSEIDKILATSRPDKQWKDILASSWVYSALSSTGVAFLNWINPLFVSITSIGTQLASVSADFVTGKLKTTDALTMIGQSFGNWVNAMSYMGAEAAFALKNDAYSNRVLEMLNNANRMHQDMMKALEKIKTGTPKEKVTNAIKFLMTSTDLVRRSMASADQMWGGVLQQFIIQNEAMRQLVTKAGLSGEQAAAILNGAAQTGQKAQQDHMAKTSDRAESVLVGKDALQQSLTDAMKRVLGHDLASDVEVMAGKEASMELGNRLSESGGPLDLINGIFEMLKLVSNSLLRKYGLNARVLTGFITVAANIINRSAYFSPVGIARALYKMNSTRAQQEKLYAQTMATDGQARMRLIEGVAGTLAILILLTLRKDSDDEEGFVITGEGPTEQKDKQAWLDAGLKPSHISWVGKDRRVKFSIPFARGGFDNLAFPMTFVGAMDDLQLQRRKLEKKNVRAAWLYGETVVMNLTNQARFFGMKNLVSSVPTSLKEGSMAKAITYSVSPVIPWSGLMKSMSRLVTGQQDQTSVNSAVMANLPLTPLVSGRPARNYLGDPVGPNATDLIGKMSERLHYAGIPIYVGVKADTRNGDIYKMLLEKGVSPSIPMRSTIESANGQITDGQWEKYLITRGNLIKDALRSDRYKIQFMEFSDAQEHIEDISRTATKATKKQLGLK